MLLFVRNEKLYFSHMSFYVLCVCRGFFSWWYIILANVPILLMWTVISSTEWLLELNKFDMIGIYFMRMKNQQQETKTKKYKRWKEKSRKFDATNFSFMDDYDEIIQKINLRYHFNFLSLLSNIIFEVWHIWAFIYGVEGYFSFFFGGIKCFLC